LAPQTFNPAFVHFPESRSPFKVGSLQTYPTFDRQVTLLSPESFSSTPLWLSREIEVSVLAGFGAIGFSPTFPKGLSELNFYPHRSEPPAPVEKS
jgi:hypothetical protein